MKLYTIIYLYIKQNTVNNIAGPIYIIFRASVIIIEIFVIWRSSKCDSKT